MPGQRFELGEYVLVPHDEDICMPAEVMAPFVAGEPAQLRSLKGGASLQLEASDTSALVALDKRALSAEISDLINISSLSEECILHVLRARFLAQHVYTAVGAIIVSVNPYEKVTERDDPSAFLQQNMPADHQPHVFSLARLAYAGVRKTGVKQAVVISGESGAGKTETTKLVLKYVAAASPRHHRHHGRATLEEQMMESNPLIEAFGNARTLRNSNSSRFGKLISVGISPKGAVSGVKITNYLLEKSRVVAHGAGERNYHIFYQLIAAATCLEPAIDVPGAQNGSFSAVQLELQPEAECDNGSGSGSSSASGSGSGSESDGEGGNASAADGGDGVSAALALRGRDPSSFAFLTGVHADGDDESHAVAHAVASADSGQPTETDADAKAWQQVRHAMRALRLSRVDEVQIFELLAALLHLGDAEFGDAADVTAQGDDHSSDVLQEDASGTVVVNREVLRVCAQLLQVEEAALEAALTTRRMGAGGRSSTVTVQYTVTQAMDARDALAKHLYANLFDWLVYKTSSALSPHGLNDATISVLDIFGFECFGHNSFEQLCINFCNQKLQCHFDDHVLRQEQAEYRRQGIAVPTVDFDDNRPCLDLLERKHTGLFALLNEAVSLPRGSDEVFLRNAVAKHADHECFSTSHRRRGVFTIAHFAGSVPYTVEGFLQKNRDALHPDLSAMLTLSTSLLVEQLLATGPGGFKRRSSVESNVAVKGSRTPVAGAGKKRAKATLASKFAGQLREMVEELDSCEPHFVRCIKPNTRSQAQLFDARMVLSQIRYTGLAQVCRIRQSGYPVCLEIEAFEKRVRRACLELESSTVALDVLLRQLERLGVLQNEMWVRGKDKVFFKSNQLARLDAHEDTLQAAATVIQAKTRACAVSRVFRHQLELVHSLTNATTARDVAQTKELLTQCEATLPSGGQRCSIVIAAHRFLEIADVESKLCAQLERALTTHNVAELRRITTEALQAKDYGRDLEIKLRRAMREINVAEIEADLTSAMSAKDYDGIVVALGLLNNPGSVDDRLRGLSGIDAQAVSERSHSVRRTSHFASNGAKDSRLRGFTGLGVHAVAELNEPSERLRGLTDMDAHAVDEIGYSTTLQQQMMEATAILSRFQREAAAELHAAMSSRKAESIRAALQRVRHMAFDTKLEAEGQSILEQVEEEERHSAQLDEARRKLSFTRRVCKPDDSTKLHAALEEAEKAGLSHSDPKALDIRRMLVHSSLASAVKTDIKLDLQEALAEAEELQVPQSDPMLQRAQNALDVLLHAEDKARQRRIANARHVLTTALDEASMKPPDALREALEVVQQGSEDDKQSMAQALASEIERARSELARREGEENAKARLIELQQSTCSLREIVEQVLARGSSLQDAPGDADAESQAPLPPRRSSKMQAPTDPPQRTISGRSTLTHFQDRLDKAQTKAEHFGDDGNRTTSRWMRLTARSPLELLEEDPGVNIPQMCNKLQHALAEYDRFNLPLDAAPRMHCASLAATMKKEMDCVEQIRSQLTIQNPSWASLHEALKKGMKLGLYAHPKMAQASRLSLRLLRTQTDGSEIKNDTLHARDTASGEYHACKAVLKNCVLRITVTPAEPGRRRLRLRQRAKLPPATMSGCIALRNATLTDGGEGIGHMKSMCFGIVHDNGTQWSFHASSTADRDHWVACLKDGIAFARNVARAAPDRAGASDGSKRRQHEKKEGILSKQGHIVKNWKRRHFVLESGKLSYFTGSNAAALRLKGEVDLYGREITVQPLAATSDARNANGERQQQRARSSSGPRPHTFELFVGAPAGTERKDFTLRLLAPSAAEMRSWIDAIDSVWEDDAGNTALLYAAVEGNAARVAALLDAGADVDHIDALGDTALLAAASAGHAEALNAFLSRGIDVNATVDASGMTPLMRAAEAGHLRCTQLLIDAGADVNATHSLTGCTAAMFSGLCLSEDHTQVTQLLLEAGASVAHRDVFGRTLEDLEHLQDVVHGCRPRIVEEPRGGTVVHDASFTLSCKASALPPASYKWIKDGKPVENAKLASLLLHHITPADAGTYVCEVSNVHGSCCSIPVNVQVVSTTESGAAEPVQSMSYRDRAVSDLRSATQEYPPGDDEAPPGSDEAVDTEQQDALARRQQSMRQKAMKNGSSRRTPSKVNDSGRKKQLKSWSFRDIAKEKAKNGATPAFAQQQQQ